MTATKAVAGGLAWQLTILVMHFLGLFPLVMEMPPDVRAALEFTIAYVIGFAAVYWVPANIARPTPPTPSEP